MASGRSRRIAKEIADIKADTISKIDATTADSSDDLTHLKGTFGGPPGTPYEGGRYSIDIRIPPEYPFRPPIMKFDTKVWHPNVSSQTVSIRTELGYLRAYTNLLGCDLPRYFVFRLVTHSHNQIRSPFSPISSQYS